MAEGSCYEMLPMVTNRGTSFRLLVLPFFSQSVVFSKLASCYGDSAHTCDVILVIPLATGHESGDGSAQSVEPGIDGPSSTNRNGSAVPSPRSSVRARLFFSSPEKGTRPLPVRVTEHQIRGRKSMKTVKPQGGRTTSQVLSGFLLFLEDR